MRAGIKLCLQRLLRKAVALGDRQPLQQLLQGSLPVHGAPGEVLGCQLPGLARRRQAGRVLQQIELDLNRRMEAIGACASRYSIGTRCTSDSVCNIKHHRQK